MAEEMRIVESLTLMDDVPGVAKLIVIANGRWVELYVQMSLLADVTAVGTLIANDLLPRLKEMHGG